MSPRASAPPSPLPTQVVTACPACATADLAPAAFGYRFVDLDFPAVRCTGCGLTFLARQPTAAGLAQVYAAEYFESDYHCGHEDSPYFACESEQVAAAGVLLAWIERQIPRGRILEVGCAGGFFLKAAAERGWSPVGVEIAASAAQFARERLGLDVRTGTLDSVELPAAAFDAVYLGDVLEHLPAPLAALREVNRVLRPGGVVMIAGPVTINSLDRRLGLLAYRALGRTKTLRQPPYHLSEFTPRTLAGTVLRAGLDVLWIREQKIPPAWRNPRRRSPLEHGLKLLVDGPNWLITHLTGRLGDRAILLAAKPAPAEHTSRL